MRHLIDTPRHGRTGLQWLRQRRELLEQLARPWPSDVIEEFKTGLGLLDEILANTRALSVEYSEDIEQLNAHQRRHLTRALPTWLCQNPGGNLVA